jgi:Flp pilus assembly pilin Flp
MTIIYLIKDALINAFGREAEDGQTLVEYGMIVSLLAIAAVVILSTVGQDVVNLFTSVSTAFTDAASP